MTGSVLDPSPTEQGQALVRRSTGAAARRLGSAVVALSLILLGGLALRRTLDSQAPGIRFLADMPAELLLLLGVGAGMLAGALIARVLMIRPLDRKPGRQAPLTGLSEIDNLHGWKAGSGPAAATQYQLSLLRSVTESTAEAIFLQDADGRVTYANPEAERMFGWKREELVGKALHNVLHWGHLDDTPYPSWASPLNQALLTGERQTDHEDVFFRRDGTAVDVACSTAPVLVEGLITGAVLSVRDVTARKRTDAALRANEARLRDLLGTLDLAAIMVQGECGVISFWSHGCERLYGWTAAQAVGRASDQLLGTEFPLPPIELQAALLRDGEWTGDLRQRRRDGTPITVAARKVLRRDAEGRIVVLQSLVDVTALREAEAALRRLNQELETRVHSEVAAREAAQVRAAQAERMHALGQLAGGIAHDFNNVLQAVSGGAMLIERQSDEPPAVRRLARMVLDATKRGAAISGRMLAFARCGDLQAEPIDTPALLASVVDICTCTLGAPIAIRTEIEPGLPPVCADKGQLETVLINLATNARDAMPGGGTLTLSARLELVAPDCGHPAGLAPGLYERISVTDTGTGMDAVTLARVAQPFFTTKQRGKGTGLGLAMAKGFSEQSGGGMAIRSELGQGTEVALWLPCADPAGGDAGTAAGEQEPVQADDGRPLGCVLLVDDHDLVRATLAEQLEAAGYAVAIAATGAEALALLDAGEAADVLVTDLSMPGMDGLAVIRGAQQRRPRLPAILLTGYPEDATGLAVDGAMTGTYSLLRKPVSGALLMARIAAHLAPAAEPIL